MQHPENNVMERIYSYELDETEIIDELVRQADENGIYLTQDQVIEFFSFAQRGLNEAIGNMIWEALHDIAIGYLHHLGTEEKFVKLTTYPGTKSFIVHQTDLEKIVEANFDQTLEEFTSSYTWDDSLTVLEILQEKNIPVVFV
jgi:hypothetical protein